MECKTCKGIFEARHDKDYFCFECNRIRGVRSKRKGRANESRFAKYLQGELEKYEVGIRVRRTPASGAIAELEKGDLMFAGKGDTVFEKIHWELKNAQNWQIEKWIAKARKSEEELEKFRTPCLIIRKPNQQEELAVVPAKFFVDMLLENEILKKELEDKE